MPSAAPQPQQQSLLAKIFREEKPWKRTTGTSRQAIRVVEASGNAEVLRLRILKAIRAIWNRRQQSPTADEIALYLYRHRVIADPHPDHVKPRLTELSRGWFRTTKDADGQVHRTRVGGGLVEKAGKRQSSRSGMTVSTWRVVEIGTGYQSDGREG